MASYIALLRKSRKSDFSVDFPDFPGCVTAGKTLEEARAMAAEALAFHIEGMEEDGAAIPDPSDLDTVQLRKEHRDAVPFLVEVDAGGQVQRINITMKTRVLREIDAYAAEIGMNRSAFLALAAKRELSGRSVRRRSGKSAVAKPAKPVGAKTRGQREREDARA